MTVTYYAIKTIVVAASLSEEFAKYLQKSAARIKDRAIEVQAARAERMSDKAYDASRSAHDAAFDLKKKHELEIESVREAQRRALDAQYAKGAASAGKCLVKQDKCYARIEQLTKL